MTLRQVAQHVENIIDNIDLEDEVYNTLEWIAKSLLALEEMAELGVPVEPTWTVMKAVNNAVRSRLAKSNIPRIRALVGKAI